MNNLSPTVATYVSRNPVALLFDLDGTLIDTMPAYADLAAEILARSTILTVAEARRAYLETSGIPFHQQVARIAPGHVDAPAMIAEFEIRKVPAFEAAELSEGIHTSLNKLRKRGIGLAISSNNNQAAVDAFVQRYRDLFDFGLGAIDGFVKGELHFEFAMRFYGCSKSELIFVGDSLIDAALADQSGVAFKGISQAHNNGFIKTKHADTCMQTLCDLIDIFPESVGDSTAL